VGSNVVSAQEKKSLRRLFSSKLCWVIYCARQGYVGSFDLCFAAAFSMRQRFYARRFALSLQRVPVVSCCYYVISTTVGALAPIKRYNKTQNLLIGL